MNRRWISNNPASRHSQESQDIGLDRGSRGIGAAINRRVRRENGYRVTFRQVSTRTSYPPGGEDRSASSGLTAIPAAGARQNPAYFLGRHREPFGNARDLATFAFPHARDDQIGEVVEHLLERFGANEALRP
jgi:hypothetical protein